jgi:hypothetical protein
MGGVGGDMYFKNFEDLDVWGVSVWRWLRILRFVLVMVIGIRRRVGRNYNISAL